MSFIDEYNSFNGFEGFNKQQISAILDSFDEQYDVYFVQAGAGSGKTKVLITRIEYIIKELKVNPSSIMAITFTNKAANELVSRAYNVTCEAEELTVGTYHHVCYKLLKEFGEDIGLKEFSLMDSYATKSVAKKIIIEMGLESSKEVIDRYLALVSKNKSKLITYNDYKEKTMNKYKGDAEKFRNDPEYDFIEFYGRYQSENAKNRVLDFDDLIIYTIFLLQKSDNARSYIDTFKYIHADEVQDSNWSNIVLLNELSKNCSLYLVGDLDQSIYHFRNARPDFFLDMQKSKKVKMFKLERNYRSTKNIVEASNSIIEHNKNRIKKVCFTNKEPGEKIQYVSFNTQKEEALYIAQNIKALNMDGEGYQYKDFMILYRKNAQSRALEDEFLRLGIPYVIIGSVNFAERKEIRDCLCFLRVAANPRDKYSFIRALKLLDGIGDAITDSIIEIFSMKGNAIKALLEFKPTDKRAKKSIDFFIDLLKLSKEKPTVMLRKVAEILIEKLMKTNTEKSISQMENIEELLNLATEKEEAGMTIKDFVSQMDLLSKYDVNSATDAVQLLTIHASKGLENKVVFVVGVNEEILPHAKSNAPVRVVEEERRCMYVACTRAEELLYLSSFKKSGDKEFYPSRFIEEIPEECIDIMEV